MPLYIVRWPGLKASLVKARNDDELLNILDEVGDPGGCKWKRYNGPVWIDFELPIEVEMKNQRDNRPLSNEELEINIDKLDDPYQIQLSIAPGNTSIDMMGKINQFAFPAYERLLDEKDDGTFTSEEIKTAILTDLAPLIEYDWRLALLNRRTDPEAEFLKKMRVTRRLPYMDPPDDEDFE